MDIFLYNLYIFGIHLYIFGIHLWTVLNPKPCYNEPSYKEVVVYAKYGINYPDFSLP